MYDGMKTVIFPVSDIAKAKTMFSALLGVDPYADEPFYVGYNVAGQEIGLDPHGDRKGMTGPVVYCHATDIKATIQALVDSGATVQHEARDIGGGKMIATVRDADGNPIGLVQEA